MESRRRFVRAACGAVVLASDLVVLGCRDTTVTDIGGDEDDLGPTAPVPTVTPDNGLLTFSLTDFPPLGMVDGAAYGYVESLGLSIVVARTSETTFIALDAKCTHGNCQVIFVPANDTFRCDCHGANFSSTGTVNNGPASSPLRTYPATFDGSIVTVDISAA